MPCFCLPPFLQPDLRLGWVTLPGQAQWSDLSSLVWELLLCVPCPASWGLQVAG